MCRVKTDAVIFDYKNDACRSPFEDDIDACCLGMFRSVVERSCNAVNVRFDLGDKPFFAHPKRMKIGRDLKVARPFLYIVFECRRQAKIIKSGRAKLKGQKADIAVYLRSPCLEFHDLFLNLRIVAAAFMQRPEAKPEHRHLLAEVIVQIAGDPMALVLL